MAMRDPMEMASQRRIGMWCFIAWFVAETSVIAAALTHGVQVSDLFHVDDTGQFNPWQALVISLSMSAFGFWMALTTKLRRIPEDRAQIAYSLKLYAKGGGWIFAVGGIIGALCFIGLLQAQ